MRVKSSASEYQSFWRGALPPLVRHLAPMLAFGLLVATFNQIVYAPLLSGVLNGLVALSGHPVVANIGLLGFLMSPVGIGTIVILCVLSIALTLIQQAGIVCISVRALHNDHTTFSGALRVVGSRLGALWTASLVMAGLTLLIALPVAALAGLTYWLLLSGADINYFLATRPPRFIAAVSIGVVLVLIGGGVWLFAQIRWIFVAPVCLFRDMGGLAAVRQSNLLARGHGWMIVRALINWFCVTLLIASITGWAFSTISAAITPDSETNEARISIILATLYFVNTIGVTIANLLSNTWYAWRIAHLYATMRAHQHLAPVPELSSVLAQRAQAHGISWLKISAIVAGTLMLLGATAIHGLGAQALAARPAVVIMAHRAGAVGVPENSLTALRRAISQGIATYAELDVQETADGVVMVIHDSDLRRLADVNARVWDLTYAEIEQADIGRKVGPQFAGERIPTLEQFLDTARNKIKLNIELKYDRAAPKLAGKVVELVRAKGMQQQVIISSLDASGLAQVRQLAPELTIGIIYSYEIGDVSRLDVDFLEPSASLVTPALMTTATARGWPVYAWTIDDADSAQHMYDVGVDAVISNDPPIVKDALEKRGALSDQQLIFQRFNEFLDGGDS